MICLWLNCTLPPSPECAAVNIRTWQSSGLGVAELHNGSKISVSSVSMSIQYILVSTAFCGHHLVEFALGWSYGGGSGVEVRNTLTLFGHKAIGHTWRVQLRDWVEIKWFNGLTQHQHKCAICLHSSKVIVCDYKKRMGGEEYSEAYLRAQTQFIFTDSTHSTSLIQSLSTHILSTL